MIYTVTLNPALDHTVILDRLMPGQVNRSAGSIMDVGGKGINVSKVVKVLGGENTALGFLGEENRDIFIKYLNDLGIANDFVLVKGKTRTNIKIVETGSGVYTDINQNGFEVAQSDVESMVHKLGALAGEGDIVVLSGSLPSGVNPDIYKEIITELKSKNVRTVLDADGEVLEKGLQAKPSLVKPNISELKKLFDFDERDIGEVIGAATRLAASGIDRVVVSMGEKGALLADGNDVLVAHPVRLPVRSTVGAGDSMVAGLVYGLGQNYGSEELFRLSAACAASKVTKEGSKPPSKDEIDAMLSHIRIERLKK